MQDPFLESWKWAKHQHGWFDSLENGWVVVARGGLDPVVEYSNQRLSGIHGWFTGTGLAGGIEPEVTLQYGDSDRLEVAKAVQKLFASTVLGGHPTEWSVLNGEYANLRVKPYGSKVYWGVNAALTERRVEYSETGCVAEVTLKFVSPRSKWGKTEEIPDPDGVMIGEEAGRPW